MCELFLQGVLGLVGEFSFPKGKGFTAQSLCILNISNINYKLMYVQVNVCNINSS